MKGGDQELNLPAGFRFHPTDEELVVYYLCRKCAGQQIAVPIIAEIDLYKFDPWNLPSMALYGEKEWYFFSPRDRKYPKGSRPNRTAGTGYWKATGADKPVGKPKTLGIKKALVFYTGKAPTGIKTNWIMHEYRLANVDRSAGKKNNLRLDDWVLCRIYNKRGTLEKHYNLDQQKAMQFSDSEDQKPKMDGFPCNGMVTPPASVMLAQKSLASQRMNDPNLHFDASEKSIPKPQKSLASQRMNDPNFHFDTSEKSIPKAHTYSSSSEQVLSPEFTYDKEIESEPKWSEFENSLGLQNTYMSSFQDDPFASQLQYNDQFYVFPDMHSFMQKPF